MCTPSSRQWPSSGGTEHSALPPCKTTPGQRVGVYRLQLFKASETFIAAQASALPTATPLLIGRALFGRPASGLESWLPPKLGPVGMFRFYAGASTEAFAAPLADRRLEILHAHFAIDGLYALPLARKLRVPLITTLHGFDVTTRRGQMLRSGRPALVRYALLQQSLHSGGDLFICVSEFIRHAALRAGFPEERLRVHYIGVDTAKFVPTAFEARPRLVHVARLVEKKGTSYLIDALAKVRQKYPDVLLDIVGDGPLRPKLEAQVASLGLAKCVRFLGMQPHEQVRNCLRGATALVLPSVTSATGDAEGLGIVLLEAAASGLPVVGTRHGGIPEALEEGVTGLLVNERDSKDLAIALDTLVGDEAARSRMGEAARARVERRFDIRRQSAELEGHYAALLA